MNKTLLRAAGVLVFALVVYASGAWQQFDTARDVNAPVAIAWSPALDGQWVETAARVYRVLPDDNKGSRHQRLLVRDPSGHSLLIAHNIDLAPRIPAPENAQLFIRGQFEWNDKGGVIHWTHHDPQGRHAGGYIDAGGERYR